MPSLHPSHTHQAGIPQTGTKAGFQVQGDYKDPERGPHQGLPSLTLPPGAAAGGGARLGRGRWAFPVVPSRRAGWESPAHSSERKTPEARLLRNWGDVTAGGSRGAAAGLRVRRAPHRVALPPRRVVCRGAARVHQGGHAPEGAAPGAAGRGRRGAGRVARLGAGERVDGDALATS